MQSHSETIGPGTGTDGLTVRFSNSLINQIPAVRETTTNLLGTVLDNTVFLAENNRQRSNVASGLVAAALRDLAGIGAAGGPGKDPDLKHHQAEIKAMLGRAQKVARRLPKKLRNKFLEQIQQIADNAGVSLPE